MNELTPQQIEKHILSAFDSVNLINELNKKEQLSDEEQARIKNNVDHLKIMMQKDWFVSGLKAAQKKEINKLIA